MHTLESGMRCFEPSYDYKVSELLVFIRAAAGITPLSRGGAFEERSRFHDIVLEGIDLVLTLSRTSGREAAPAVPNSDRLWMCIRRPLRTL